MTQPSLLVVAPVAHATPKCVTNTRNALIIPMYSQDNADADCEDDDADDDDDEECSVRPTQCMQICYNNDKRFFLIHEQKLFLDN